MRTSRKRQPLLDRQVGIETEYALCFDRRRNPDARHTPLIESMIGGIKRRCAHALGMGVKGGIFLENGSAIFPERAHEGSAAGLIEAATPECRTARQVLAYSRAQDRLVAEAADRFSGRVALRLVKNDRDGRGNVYGAQENYDALVATGFSLFLWRVGVLILIALALILVIVVGLYFAALAIGALVLLIIYAIGFFASKKFARFVEKSPSVAFAAKVTMRCIEIPLIALSASTLLPLYLLCRWFGFRMYTSQLVPFLATRSIFCGAGWIDPSGHFHVSDKSAAVRTVYGVGGIRRPPMLEIGHFGKTIFWRAWRSPHTLKRLLGRRQRLQISSGDSNMAEHAEFLRIGTTMLVLEAIESGYIKRFPKLKRPVKAVRQICSDGSLKTKVRLSRGIESTAVEIQKRYLDACRQMIQEREDTDESATEVLRMWASTLESIQDRREELVGRVDWITKAFMIRQLGNDATLEAKKKIDLRYHELSPEGYFRILDETELNARVLDPSEIEFAMHHPPANTRAARRAGHIQNQSTEKPLYADWDRVRIGSFWRGRTILLDNS